MERWNEDDTQMEDLSAVITPLPINPVIEVDFSLKSSIFLPQLADKTQFEVLIIKNIPQQLDAVALFMQDWFIDVFYDSHCSVSIYLEINETLKPLTPLQYHAILLRLYQNRKFLLFFESIKDWTSCYYWKNIDHEKMHTLTLTGGMVKAGRELNAFIFEFIYESLSVCHCAISDEFEDSFDSDLSIFTLADILGYNLLMKAAEAGHNIVLSSLLSSGFDTNHIANNDIAADLAYKNKHFSSLLHLLKANSLYPIGFSEFSAPMDIKEFMRVNKALTKLVKSDQLEAVLEAIGKHQHLRHFYSTGNQSIAHFALSRKKYEIYKALLSHNVYIGPKEDVDQCIGGFSEKRKEQLRQIHLQHVQDSTDKFLMILNANTFVGHDIPDINEKLTLARSAFEYLSKIPLVLIILQVVAASRDFKIIFDFNRESIQHMDPTSDEATRGAYHTSSHIYVAAKLLGCRERMVEAIATLSHELCHFALNLVYKNSCRPYRPGDVDTGKRFHNVFKSCEFNKRREKLIRVVCDLPKEDIAVRHAELIVRVPHMLVLYNDDQTRLDDAQEMFASLFNFFEDRVIGDMRKALPTIENTADGVVQKFNCRNKSRWLSMNVLAFVLVLTLMSAICFVLGFFVIGPIVKQNVTTLTNVTLAFCNIVHSFR